MVEKSRRTLEVSLRRNEDSRIVARQEACEALPHAKERDVEWHEIDKSII